MLIIYGALEELKKSTGAKFLIYRKENENLRNPIVNLTWNLGADNVNIEADSRVDDNDSLHVGNVEFKVIHTPGHTSGGSSLYMKDYNVLFTGDTLFKGTYGRCDLPTGSVDDIMNSIKNKLFMLPNDTMIYPGHGLPSLIGDEKKLYS